LGIGHEPNIQLFKNWLQLDDKGYIQVKPGTCQTSLPGIFAAGDVADSVYQQGVIAAGTGAMAAIEADRFLQS
jgi:thioredoxin reductase (NADPH)